MTTDIKSYYDITNNVNITRNKDGTFNNKSNASVDVYQVPDTVSFTWQYTKDIV